MSLIWIFLLISFFLGVATCYCEWRLHRMRRVGEYPLVGLESMADVEALLARGEKTLAIRCYRMVTGLSLREAKNTVDAMAVSSKVL